MRIFIDADSSPIIDITINTAKIYNIPVIIVKNQAHEIYSDYAEIITVDISTDSADFYIFNNIKSGDILISQDLGLIAMALSKKVICLNHEGELIKNYNIDFILQNRHISNKLRREQGIYSKFKKRESKMDSQFKSSLTKIIKENI